MKHSRLVMILDRSGSMTSIASEMEGAMKEIINKQKVSKEEILVTYARFDDEYEEVFSEKPISEIDGFRLEPRGMTALLDAIGKTINSVEQKIIKKDEENKPERVLFVIITDGHENASREFNRSSIFKKIEKVKKDYGWDFTFIGANQDSISEGSSIGISVNSSLDFDTSKRGISNMSEKVSNYASSYFCSGIASYYDVNEDKHNTADLDDN